MPPSVSRGFTLIELIVVVAILSILLGMAVPSVIAIEAGEKQRAATDLLDAHATAIRALGEDLKRLPQSLNEISSNTSNNAQWKGPYLTPPAGATSASTDPWGTTLQAQQLDQKTVRLRSAGPDRVFANADDATLDVSIAQALRVATRFTVDRVNIAINAHNAVYLPNQPLTGNIDNVVATLQTRGLLPSGFDWTTDGFGVKLQTSGSPVTYVFSTSGS